MDPLMFLKTTDLDERFLMQAIAAGARAVQREHDLERANQIASEVNKLLPRG